MKSDDGGPLRPRLDEVEEVVEQALNDVCAEGPPQQLDTGELIRIEETLAIAAEAAKEAVTLRRKIGSRRDPDPPPPQPAR